MKTIFLIALTLLLGGCTMTFTSPLVERQIKIQRVETRLLMQQKQIDCLEERFNKLEEKENVPCRP